MSPTAHRPVRDRPGRGPCRDRLRRGWCVDPGDQGRQAARARGFVHDPAAAAARGAAVRQASGAADFEAVSWHALLVPSKTPKEVVDRLHAEMKKIMSDPGDDEAGSRHRADPDRVAVGRRHQRLHQVGAREVGCAGRQDRTARVRSRVLGMAGRLQDKVALVTGAGCVGPGWGNGRATAVRFAQEGAKVFAADKNRESMKETVAQVREFGEDDPHLRMRCDRQRLGHGDGRGLHEGVRPHRHPRQ